MLLICISTHIYLLFCVKKHCYFHSDFILKEDSNENCICQELSHEITCIVWRPGHDNCLKLRLFTISLKRKVFFCAILELIDRRLIALWHDFCLLKRSRVCIFLLTQIIVKNMSKRFYGNCTKRFGDWTKNGCFLNFLRSRKNMSVK